MFDTITSATDFVIHARRWPLHNDPAKGQVLGGTCNTFGCTEIHASNWCALTFAFYCETCACEINHGPSPSCEPVGEKNPTSPR